MKIQKFNALTIFVFLINMISAYGMEQNNNDLHPLLYLPVEVQHQIVFPQYTKSTEITLSKMNELEAIVKIFFRFKRVCKHFNQYLKFPWSDWTIEEKDKIVEEVMHCGSGCAAVFRLYMCIKYDGKNEQALEKESAIK